MKKVLLSLAATAMCASAYAALGDVTTILDQSFNDSTTLENTKTYQWGNDIQGMIGADGLLMTNSGDAANNYDNRPFITFPTKSPIGNETKEVMISYDLFNAKGFGQDPAYYTINYFDAKNKFLFGIQEGIGGWSYPASIVTANEDGSTTVTPLPVQHIVQGTPQTVNLSVRFAGNDALIDIDSTTYTAYCNKAGILAVKLSVSGNKDWNRGLNIQKFTIQTKEVEKVQLADYTLKYVCGTEVLNTVTKKGVVGSAISVTDAEMASFWNEDKTVKYIYECNDAEGKTIDAEGTTVVTLTYREAETWNYTVKNNVNDKVISGSCVEGESATVAYSRYALTADGAVWLKDATNKEYHYTFTPNANNYETTIEYTETGTKDGVYFAEAEDIEGMTETTSANANIRCSNAAGGYVTEGGALNIYTLPAGTYKVAMGVWGNAAKATEENPNPDPITFTVKAGENEVLSAATEGWWFEAPSEEFTLEEETALSFEGADKDHPVDYFLITKVTQKFNYTVKNNVNDEVLTSGECVAGDKITIPYSRYILAEDGTIWVKEATNKEYNFTFAPDSVDYVATIEYKATDIKDGIYFAEAENIEGMTKVTEANANIRCSNAAGGYADQAFEIYTLKAGTYKVKIGVWGNKGTNFTVKAGEKEVLTTVTQSHWFEADSEEFVLDTETAITFEGATSTKPLDFILITGTVGSSAVEAVEAVNADNNWYNLQGVKIAQPTKAGLYIHNGKKIIVK